MKKYLFTKHKDLDSYLKTEWYSVSDIGEEFNGSILTVEDYSAVEDSYVKAIDKVLDFMKIEKVKITQINKMDNFFYPEESFSEQEKNSKIEDIFKFGKFYADKKILYNNEMLRLYDNLSDGDEGNLNREQLADIIRLQLRDHLGALIFVPYRLQIRVGFDFKVQIITSKSLEPIFDDIKSFGINIFEIEYIQRWVLPENRFGKSFDEWRESYEN